MESRDKYIAGKQKRYQESPQVKIAAEFETRSGEQVGDQRITGYAAVFNQPATIWDFVKVIRKGAFSQTLKDGHDIAAFIQHEGGLSIIGRTSNDTLKLSEDDHGLKYEVTPPDTQAGRDILTLIEGKFITKSSFAFSVSDGGEKWTFEANPPLRELTKLDLYEVSPVDFPAYTGTSVHVKSENKAQDALKRALKNKVYLATIKNA